MKEHSLSRRCFVTPRGLPSVDVLKDPGGHPEPLTTKSELNEEPGKYVYDSVVGVCIQSCSCWSGEAD
jgi:hypothetical protein